MFDLTDTEAAEVAEAIWSENPSPVALRLAANNDGALDPLSLRVVHLAREEAWLSAPIHGVGARVWHWLLGDMEPPRHLANPRLEMLRNFCIFVNLGDARSEDLARTMLAKGHYTQAQLAVARDQSIAA